MHSPKVAIVTGASSGLGLQIANDLHRNGYVVAVCSRHALKDTPFYCEALDITDKTKVKNFVKKVAKKFGRIDLLINNAGYVHPSLPITGITDRQILDSFQTNVYGPFYFMREVIPIMKKQKEGKIINIASKSAVYANPTLAVYSASKSALLKMTESIAKEFRDTNTNILCITISPAGMNTKMRAAVYGKDDAKKQMDVRTVATIIMSIVLDKNLSDSTYKYNNKAKIEQGANVIIKKGNAYIKLMEDG